MTGSKFGNGRDKYKKKKFKRKKTKMMKEGPVIKIYFNKEKLNF